MTSTEPAQSGFQTPRVRPVQAPVRSLSNVTVPRNVSGQTLAANRSMSMFIPSSRTDIENRPIKKRKLTERLVTSPVTTVPRVENDITAENGDMDQLKLKYRPVQPHLDSGTSVQSSLISVDRSDQQPQLPVPPWKKSSVTAGKANRARFVPRKRAELAVPNIPDVVAQPGEPSDRASVRLMDSFPWTGSHLEDQLSTENINKGWHDKAPAQLERELNTARGPLYAAFKHKHSLDSLSILFDLVLEQKAKHGIFSSSSSFRPPPRVTLTENKRIAWMNDLADESVPLRRLSRTIPNGIKGQVLLEQCMAQNVSLNRTLWFAQCVGVNEMRALRRKGTAPNMAAQAEIKWIKDWSTNIESWFESLVLRADSTRYDDNMQYAIRLCRQFYVEGLLDRDHFLCWLTKTLYAVPVAQPSVWLSLVKLFRTDMLRYRLVSKEFAIALVNLAAEVLRKDRVIESATRLKAFVRDLVLEWPFAFILPERWPIWEDVLKACLDPGVTPELHMFENIKRSNEQLLERNFDIHNSTRPERIVVDLLDHFIVRQDVDDLSWRLTNSGFDQTTIMHSCLHWATTRYRSGRGRLYIVSRLLRKWSTWAYDETSTCILNFYQQDTRGTDIDAYRQMFAELSRSNTFAASHHLQYVSVCGQPVSERHTSLLLDMCLPGEDGHLIIQRDHLLELAKLDFSDVKARAEILKIRLTKCLVEDEWESLDAKDYKDVVSNLGYSYRFQLACWLRDHISKLLDVNSDPALAAFACSGRIGLSLNKFLLVRSMIESCGDMAILADILYRCAVVKQEAILSAAVDTLHNNAEVLHAVGAFSSLQTLYCRAYLSLRQVNPGLSHFALALQDLCRHYPCSVLPTKALQLDILKGLRGRALQATSPFSDGVAEELSQAGPNFIESFEHILDGEFHMSQSTMTSLFEVLTEKIEKSFEDSANEHALALCMLLARLQLYGKLMCDKLMEQWIGGMVSTRWSMEVQNLLLELLATRCIDLQTMQHATRGEGLSLMYHGSTRPFLEHALQTTCSFSQPEYVLHLKANQFVEAYPEAALEILGTKAVQSPAMQRLVLRMLQSESSTTRPSRAADHVLGVIAREILLKNKPIDEPTYVDVVGSCSALSLPLTVQALRYESNNLDAQGNETKARALLNLLQMNCQVDQPPHPYARELFEALHPQLQAQIRNLLFAQFFDALPRYLQLKPSAAPVRNRDDVQRETAKATGSIVITASASGTIPNTTGMIEKMAIYNRILSSKIDGSVAIPPTPAALSPTAGTPTGNNAPLSHNDKRQEVLVNSFSYLHMLLRVINTQSTSDFSGSTSQIELVKLIGFIINIATQPTILDLLSSNIQQDQKVSINSCVAFAFDVATRLSDHLTMESRLFCVKVLKDKMLDDRVAWIIGSFETEANMPGGRRDDLSLVSDAKGDIGPFRPKSWDMLESGGGKEGDTCLGLGMFNAKRV